MSIGKWAPARSYYLGKVAEGIEDYYAGEGEAEGILLGHAAIDLGLEERSNRTCSARCSPAATRSIARENLAIANRSPGVSGGFQFALTRAKRKRCRLRSDAEKKSRSITRRGARGRVGSEPCDCSPGDPGAE